MLWGVTAEEARVKLEGSGSAVIFATDAVYIGVEGSGHATVAGKPVRRDVDISGNGWVTFE
jgi:hypothetical protein